MILPLGRAERATFEANGLSEGCVKKRLLRGWSVERAITEPAGRSPASEALSWQHPMLNTWLMVWYAQIYAKEAGRAFCRVEVSPAWTVPSGPMTTLNACDICGRLGTRRRVTHRHHIYRWNSDGPRDWKTPSKHMLCVGCWNKARALVRAISEADEIRRLGRKLHREALKCRKAQSKQAAI